MTKPFAFEGRQRGMQADRGIAELRDVVDTLITIPNEKLLGVVSRDVTIVDAFKQADHVLYEAVKGISDLITVHGLVNLDFADVRTVMNEMGMALMGSGISSGEERAVEAATRAISSPLLEDVSIKGATGILINITGGPDMTLHEISEASKIVQEEAHEDANILFGAVIDKAMKKQIRVTVIATGFNKPLGRVTRSASSSAVRGFSRVTQPPAKTAPAQPEARSVGGVGQGSLSVGASRQMPQAGPSKETVAVREQDLKSELKEIARDIGILEYQSDEYDIPTFLRKQAD